MFCAVPPPLEFLLPSPAFDLSAFWLKASTPGTIMTPHPGGPHSHPDDGRTRSSLACGNCRQRKIRCTGGNPCKRCSELNRPCHYARVTQEENLAARAKKAAQAARRAAQTTTTVAAGPSASSSTPPAASEAPLRGTASTRRRGGASRRKSRPGMTHEDSDISHSGPSSIPPAHSQPTPVLQAPYLRQGPAAASARLPPTTSNDITLHTAVGDWQLPPSVGPPIASTPLDGWSQHQHALLPPEPPFPALERAPVGSSSPRSSLPHTRAFTQSSPQLAPASTFPCLSLPQVYHPMHDSTGLPTFPPQSTPANPPEAMRPFSPPPPQGPFAIVTAQNLSNGLSPGVLGRPADCGSASGGSTDARGPEQSSTLAIPISSPQAWLGPVAPCGENLSWGDHTRLQDHPSQHLDHPYPLGLLVDSRPSASAPGFAPLIPGPLSMPTTSQAAEYDPVPFPPSIHPSAHGTSPPVAPPPPPPFPYTPLAVALPPPSLAESERAIPPARRTPQSARAVHDAVRPFSDPGEVPRRPTMAPWFQEPAPYK